MARKRKQPESGANEDSADQVKPDPGVSAKAAANVADSLASSKYTGPFPDFERPTAQECRVRLHCDAQTASCSTFSLCGPSLSCASRLVQWPCKSAGPSISALQHQRASIPCLSSKTGQGFPNIAAERPCYSPGCSRWSSQAAWRACTG